MAGAIGMREADELSRVIGDIYDASLDPALWPNAIECICDYIGAASASLHSQDSISRATDALFWWGRESSAPHFFKIYLEKYGKINPIFPGVIFFDVEQPVAVPDVISCEEFVRTRFFREWLAPQSLMDGLFSNLEKGGDKLRAVHSDAPRRAVTSRRPHAPAVRTDHATRPARNADRQSDRSASCRGRGARRQSRRARVGHVDRGLDRPHHPRQS
jgi:hypothetical protein